MPETILVSAVTSFLISPPLKICSTESGFLKSEVQRTKSIKGATARAVTNGNL